MSGAIRAQAPFQGDWFALKLGFRGSIGKLRKFDGRTGGRNGWME